MIDAGWPDVVLDADAEAGAIRLVVDERSVSVGRQTWIGFPEFVVLVATTPAAAARLTPAGRREVRRLLGIRG